MFGVHQRHLSLQLTLHGFPLLSRLGEKSTPPEPSLKTAAVRVSITAILLALHPLGRETCLSQFSAKRIL